MSRYYSVSISEFNELINAAIEEHRNTNDPIPSLNANSLNKVETCLATPFQNVFGQELYPDVYDKAAILLYLFIKNHPLANGNKRMAFIVMSFFLYKNDIELNLSNDNVYQLTKNIASSKPEDKDEILIYINTIINTKTMATIAELEAKIKKAKANSMMPENLKKQYIAKIEKEIAAMKPEEKKEPAKKEKPKRNKLSFEADVIAEMEEQGEMTYSDASGMLMTSTNESIMEQAFKDGKSAKQTAKKILGIEEKEIVKSETKKATPKKDDDYDCDEIIADLKAKKAKQKAASKKANNTPTVKKDEKAVERVGKSIKKHYKEGELTKAQIEVLIKELTDQINELKKLLKSAK